MNDEIRLELLRMADKREPTRPVRDVMTLAESLANWVETRRFPEEPTSRYTADCTPR